LEGPSRIGRVTEVLVAGNTTHARRQDGISGRAARRWSPRGQASEETAAGLLDGVQLPAGDAVLLFDVLARVQRRRATIPGVHNTTRTAEAAVEVYLRRDVHLSQTGTIKFPETQPENNSDGLRTLIDKRSDLRGCRSMVFQRNPCARLICIDN